MTLLFMSGGKQGWNEQCSMYHLYCGIICHARIESMTALTVHLQQQHLDVDGKLHDLSDVWMGYGIRSSRVPLICMLSPEMRRGSLFVLEHSGSSLLTGIRGALAECVVGLCAKEAEKGTIVVIMMSLRS